MTEQELVDTILIRMAKQKWKGSYRTEEDTIKGANNCLYRSANNKCCAVGAVLPDSLYDVEFDASGMDVSYLKRHFTEKVWELKDSKAEVPKDLQDFHVLIKDHTLLLDVMQSWHDGTCIDLRLPITGTTKILSLADALDNLRERLQGNFKDLVIHEPKHYEDLVC